METKSKNFVRKGIVLVGVLMFSGLTFAFQILSLQEIDSLKSRDSNLKLCKNSTVFIVCGKDLSNTMTLGDIMKTLPNKLQILNSSYKDTLDQKLDDWLNKYLQQELVYLKNNYQADSLFSLLTNKSKLKETKFVFRTKTEKEEFLSLVRIVNLSQYLGLQFSVGDPEQVSVVRKFLNLFFLKQYAPNMLVSKLDRPFTYDDFLEKIKMFDYNYIDI